jgi:hypothetical protein
VRAGVTTRQEWVVPRPAALKVVVPLPFTSEMYDEVRQRAPSYH